MYQSTSIPKIKFYDLQLEQTFKTNTKREPIKNTVFM